MNQNDYVILFDEKGTPYIAHAGWLDNARNAVRGAANTVSNTAQQVVNRAKGVGRGVRTNHKYILKVNENGRTRYFYRPEEVKAYYEAKRKGIKNPAEYAQKAADAASNAVDTVKNVASKAVNTAKAAYKGATGITSRETMDEMAKQYPDVAARYNTTKQAHDDADKAHKNAINNYLNSTLQTAKAGRMLNDSNIFNRNARRTNYETAKAQEEQYRNAMNQAEKNAKDTEAPYREANDKYLRNNLRYQLAKADYEQSLAGAVDRTAAKARETASNVRNTVANVGRAARQAIEDASGVTAKKNAEASSAAAAQAKRDSAQADRAAEDNRKAYQVDKSKDNRERYNESKRGAAQDYQRYADAALQKVIDNSIYRNTPLGKAESEAKAVKEVASSAYNKAKDAANNTVSNAKNAYERMKDEFKQRTGADLKERAQTAEQEYRDAEAERRKAAGQFSSDVDRDLASQKALKKNPNSAHAQSERDQSAAAVRKSGEEYYKEGGALDTVSKARDKMNEAQKEYNDFKDSHSPKAMIDQAKNAIVDKAKDIAGYDERERARQLRSKANAEYERAPTSNEAREAIANATGAETAYNKTPLGMIENAKKAVSSAIKPVQGMIDNARSSTAKAVNEAWDKIPKNADGTVNPFDPNFQSTYTNWKNRKDQYDNSLTGRAKEAAEKATDSVKDMIDQAKKVAKNTATSAQNALDNATGNNYRKRAQEANQAAENAINQRARTSDQLENQRSNYGSKTNDSEHIYGDSEGYYYKTKEQRDRAESLISKRDQYDADIVNNNQASKVNDSRYADSKAGRINSLLGRETSSTSERSNSKATEVNNKWDRQEAESKLIGGRLDPDINVSKEYVYSRASNSGMAGEVRQVMQLEEAMRSAERAYEHLNEDSSKPQSSSRAARQKMLQAQDAYERAYKELIDDINKQYDQDLADYERRYGKYNRG